MKMGVDEDDGRWDKSAMKHSVRVSCVPVLPTGGFENCQPPVHSQ